MSFFCPIIQYKRNGLDCIRVDVNITVIGSGRQKSQPFIFDTGCEITTVSEDLAVKLGLPSGGRSLNVKGVTSREKGRIVDVRFRFPNILNGQLGLECQSKWVIVSGVKNRALLGFQEVHKHFSIRAFEFDMYFIPWSTLRGKYGPSEKFCNIVLLAKTLKIA